MDPFTDVVSAVGITLVHFLWQGAAIGLATAAILATCPRAMARTRYLIAGAGLVAMTMAPLVTLGLVWQTAPAMLAGLPAFPTQAFSQINVGAVSLSPAGLAPWLPAAVGVWALGVILLTTRLVVAWFRTERVRHRDVRPVPEGLAIAVRRLARTLGIRRVVAVFESPWVDVPAVIGWLRPTILLPIGAFTGLSIHQIEAVLSHELAHIKRHDYLVNVLQNLAETVFFYHPAVWWVSRQIRIEREHCCDDVAVEACGNPVMYARALTALEESRQRQDTFALAATDGSLIDRVRRLVVPPHVDTRRPSLPIAVCVAVILAVLAFSGAQAQGPSGPTFVDATQEYSMRVVLPPGSAVMIPADERIRLESNSFELVDATTTYVDGALLYSRGTAEDMASLLEQLQKTTGPQRSAVGQPALSAQVSQVAPAPPPPPPAPAPVRVGGAIREPRKIVNVAPIYPEPARTAGISGVVIIAATIDPDGLPVNLKILRSIPDLDQAAINAVRQWRYQPTLLNGVPVAVMMTVTVNFTLQASPSSSQSLEARYAALQREAQELAKTPQEVEARYRELQLQMAMLERQISVARAQVTGRTAPAGGPQVAPTPEGVLRVGGDIREPRKVRNVAPVYPAIAQASNVSGVVILDITINTEGSVTDVRVLRSIPMLDNAAVEAVRQWQYEPTLLNGVPTPVQMTVTVNFTLH